MIGIGIGRLQSIVVAPPGACASMMAMWAAPIGTIPCRCAVSEIL